jgi:hypothetical protein
MRSIAILVVLALLIAAVGWLDPADRRSSPGLALTRRDRVQP